MKKCEYCGKYFDKSEAKDEFECNIIDLDYENFNICLCGECAIEAIENEVDGIYYDICHKCGKQFDIMNDTDNFRSYFEYENGIELRDTWDSYPLCCDCAIETISNRY